MNLEYVLPIFQIPFVYCHHTNVVTSPSLVEMKKKITWYTFYSQHYVVRKRIITSYSGIPCHQSLGLQ